MKKWTLTFQTSSFYHVVGAVHEHLFPFFVRSEVFIGTGLNLWHNIKLCLPQIFTYCAKKPKQNKKPPESREGWSWSYKHVLL